MIITMTLIIVFVILNRVYKSLLWKYKLLLKIKYNKIKTKTKAKTKKQNKKNIFYNEIYIITYLQNK